jgi:O-antigen/teichoic acid export membrane protein
LFFTALNGAQAGILAGLEAFRATAAANLARLVLLPAIVWMMVRAPRIETAIAGLSAAAAISCFINYLSIRANCARHGIRIDHVGGIAEWRLLFTFSLPVILASLLVGPVNWACNAFLLRQPDGYAQLGIFTAASQWRVAVAFLPGVLAQSSLPMLSNLRTASAARYRQVLRWNLALTVCSATAIALLVCVLSRWIMGIYGKDFASGWSVLVLCAGVGALTALNLILGSLLISSGKVWPCAGFNALWATTVLMLTYYLVPAYGAMGLALAFLLAYSAHTIWQGFYGLHVARQAAGEAR